MLEIEIKVKIQNPDLIREKFEKIKGTYKFSFIHKDTYFNMPQGLRDFKKTDEALRIRKSVEYNKKKKQAQQKAKYFITYKGKKLDKITKTRSEIEIEITNGNDLRELLKALGFREIFTVEKERELYEFNYKGQIIEALIDYIPILKENFIEVEIVSESDDKLEESREILFNFLSLFDIKKEDSITKSYLELIAEKFKR